MIDTLRIKSPYLSESLGVAVDSRLKSRIGVDNATGETLYEIVSDALEGSFDHRVSVRVMREEIVYLKPLRPWGKGTTTMRACAPYVLLEGSVHKAIMGHNVYGGPLDVLPAARWFVRYVGKLLGVVFPPADEWFVCRVDWAEAYEMGSYEGCEEYIQGMNRCHYPRRKANRYGSQALMFSGTVTSWKVYHKGPEFDKHDRKRLSSLEEFDVPALQGFANQVLRVETSIKLPKLKEDFKDLTKKRKKDFGSLPLVSDLTRSYLESVHDINTARVLRDGESEMETVRTAREVRARLHSKYRPTLANTLYGLWVDLSTMDEQEVRCCLPRPTWYRHKKQLEDAGVSWTGTDVLLKEHSHIPQGFAPVRNDPRRMTEESPEVRRALAAYSVAV